MNKSLTAARRKIATLRRHGEGTFSVAGRAARRMAGRLSTRQGVAAMLVIVMGGAVLLSGISKWRAANNPRPAPVPRSGKDIFAIGVTLPVKALDGRGLLIDVANAKGPGGRCDRESHVWMVIYPSAEFWTDHPESFVRPSKIAVAVRGGRVVPDRYDAGLDHDGDATSALRYSGTYNGTRGLEQSAPVLERVNDADVIVVPTPPFWKRARNPVFVHFLATGLSAHRSPGTCWLMSPTLTGSLADTAASFGTKALWRTSPPSERTAPGASFRATSSAVTRGRSLIADDGWTVATVARPEPDLVSVPGPVWACKRPRVGSGHRETSHLAGAGAIETRGGNAYPVGGWTGGADESGCAARVAVSRGGGDSDAQKTFLSGLLLSFGSSILLSGFGLLARALRV